tara:strand:+ start:364 stop:723 length:360 start_codon:yes stop_codon:yes gene_type:complete
MSKRAQGEYFSVFTNKDATDKQPTQTGKLQVNAEMLEAMTDIARSQQMNGVPIEVDIGLGFWVQTAKESGVKYLRGRPAVFVSDEVEEKIRELGDYAEGVTPPAAPTAEGSFDDNEIPF